MRSAGLDLFFAAFFLAGAGLFLLAAWRAGRGRAPPFNLHRRSVGGYVGLALANAALGLGILLAHG